MTNINDIPYSFAVKSLEMEGHVVGYEYLNSNVKQVCSKLSEVINTRITNIHFEIRGILE